jgi:hypothetical protein
MRTKYSRIAAVVLALTAGGLAAFALRPAAGSSTGTLAARNPAVEVRTQVIRRTIHVIRHEPGASLRGSRRSTALFGAGHGAARTHASGGHGSSRVAGTASAAAVATRASGTHVTGTGRSSPPAGPVTTRSSGSHGSTSTGTSARPVTRSSGGGHGHGGEGGDGHGGDD